MPTALDRFLARPNALRTLRRILDVTETGKSRISPNQVHHLGYISRRWQSVAAAAIADAVADTTTEVKIRYHAKGKGQAKVDQPLLNNWTVMKFQSSIIAEQQDHKSFLVDYPKNRNNWALWVQLLEFQQRNHGDQGIRKIWKALQLRGMILPIEGSEARILWTAFISEKSLAKEAVAYATAVYGRESFPDSFLYQTVMVRWIDEDPVLAWWCHRQLAAKFAIPLDAMPEIAIAAARSKNIHSLSNFRRVYLDTPGIKVYDALIPELHAQQREQPLLWWHRFLSRHHDTPTRDSAATKWLLQATMAKRTKRTISARTFVGVDDSPTVSEDSTASSESQEVKIITTGRSHVYPGHESAAKPRPFDDSFGARLFATRITSVTTIIKGLQAFGIEAIGLLSLRELAARAGSTHELSQHLKMLKSLHIDIPNAAFAKALTKFAAEERMDLVEDLLSSDVHPEEYDNAQVQQQLLQHYVENRDWRQVKRTLAILTFVHERPERQVWNLLFQTHAKLRDREAVISTLNDMLRNHIKPSHDSLKVVARHLLRPRRVGKGPRVGKVDGQKFPQFDVRFVANLYIRAAQQGVVVSTHRWNELLVRFGMTLCMEEHQNLSLWLAASYKPKLLSAPPSISLAKALQMNPSPGRLALVADPGYPIHEIFDPKWFVTQVIGWWIRAALTRKVVAYQRHLWARGLSLLKRLRDDHGIKINSTRVSRELTRQFFFLFGPSRTLKPINRVVRRRAHKRGFTLEEMLPVAEEIWGGEGSLFPTSTPDGLHLSPYQRVFGEDLKIRVDRPSHAPSYQGKCRNIVLDSTRYKEWITIVPGQAKREFERFQRRAMDALVKSNGYRDKVMKVPKDLRRH